MYTMGKMPSPWAGMTPEQQQQQILLAKAQTPSLMQRGIDSVDRAFDFVEPIKAPPVPEAPKDTRTSGKKIGDGLGSLWSKKPKKKE